MNKIASRSNVFFPRHWLYRAYLRGFAVHLSALGYQPGSQRMYHLAAGEFLGWWESKNHLSLGAFERPAAAEYYHYLQRRPLRRGTGTLGPSMLAHHRLGLRLFFGYLESNGYLAANPLSGWHPEVGAKSERGGVLSPKEVGRLYGACENLRERMILDIYYGCGLRRKEGEALNTSDLDLTKGHLQVRQGKGKRARVVPFTHAQGRQFRAWLYGERPEMAQGGEKSFLLNQLGYRLRGNSANRLFQGLQKRAGLEASYSLHDLRHGVATHLLEKGLAVEQVRDFLGHQHLESTQVYLHELDKIHSS